MANCENVYRAARAAVDAFAMDVHSIAGGKIKLLFWSYSFLRLSIGMQKNKFSTLLPFNTLHFTTSHQTKHQHPMHMPKEFIFEEKKIIIIIIAAVPTHKRSLNERENNKKSIPKKR